MQEMKKVVMIIIAAFMMFSSLAQENVQAAQVYTFYVNCDGGTYEEKPGMNNYDMRHILEKGNTLAKEGKVTVKDPTCAGKQFLGWYAFNSDTGTQLENGKLFTTQELMNYKMPDHSIEFKAQWKGSTITSITYAALYNKTGEVDYNAKVTLVNNGISYSGQGFVTIPQSVYSTWTGTVSCYWEFPGEYINANYRYISDSFDGGTMSVANFKKEKSCWQAIYKSSGEAEVFPPRAVVDQFFTYASDMMPDISTVSTTPAGDVISNTSIVPSNYTVTTNRYESGAVYDQAITAAQTKYGSSNVLVYNIELKDTAGIAVHQLSGTVDVNLSLPTHFTVQSGKRIVVYYLNDSGTLEECPTTYDDAAKTVTFQTNHFSLYIVAEVEKAIEDNTSDIGHAENQEDAVDTDNSPSSNGSENDQAPTTDSGEDSSISWLVWAAAAVAVVIIPIVFIFLLKKRK